MDRGRRKQDGKEGREQGGEKGGWQNGEVAGQHTKLNFVEKYKKEILSMQTDEACSRKS